MCRKSLHVRLVFLCLSLALFTSLSSAQISRTPEGSLRVVGQSEKENGLCPLKSTQVRAEISGFVSRVSVTQVFQNPYDRVIEAVYTFPLPNDAAVNDMTIQVGDRLIRGKILEREQARETYEKAKQEGKVAALLDQQRPNIFTQAVANITPGQGIKVVIEYVETLKYQDDSYEFTFPMTIGERYIPSSADGEDAKKISPRSKLRPGHTISIDMKLDAGVPLQGIYSNTHKIATQQFSASEYHVSLQDENEIPNRDFVLRYKTAGTKLDDAVLATKDKNGGFFTLILQPPDAVMPADTMPKEIVFVLDTSGSMDGFPIKKAKEAMNLTLDNLNPSDTFNLITFAGDTRVVFDEPVPATPENLDRARKVLSDTNSGGGTEMMAAIKAALEPSDSKDHVRIVCFMTDGQVGNDNEIIAEVQKHQNARVFAFGIGSSVNHFLLDSISREGRGDVEYVDLNDNGSAAAKRFYERIRNPLLTDISLDFEGVEVSDVLPKSIPDVFDAKPVNVVGRYGKGGPGKIILKGMMRGVPYQREIAVDLPESSEDNSVLPTLWARLQVADLMRRDYTGLAVNNVQTDLKSAITELGLKYRLMTPFTSFVAVDDRVVTDGSKPTKVDVPVAKPIDSAEQLPGVASSTTPSVGTYGPPINSQNYPPNPPGVSGVAEVVTVAAASSATETSTVSSNITTRQVQDLPMNGRSMQSLVLLTPGSAAVTADTNKEQPSIRGARAGNATFTVDGASANLGVQSGDSSLSRNIGSVPALTASGGTNGVLAADATQEVTVRTMSTAEFGRSAGPEISVISRSGTNQYRGSLFETFGNDKLNSNDAIANSRGIAESPSSHNQFGGTLGGFLIKNEAFFFGNYEGLRLRRSTFAISEVPTLASRSQASPLLYPFLNSFALPNGPATSPGLAEFAAAYSAPADHDIFGLRVDARPTDKLSLTGRFNFSNSFALSRASQGLALNTSRQVNIQTTSGNGEAVYTISPNLLITGRLNVSRNRVGQQISTDAFGGAVVDPSLFLQSPGGFFRYGLSAQNAVLENGNRLASTIDQIEPSIRLNWARGSHVFAFGGEYRRLSFKTGIEPLERDVLFNGAGLESPTARIIEILRMPAGRRTASNTSVYAEDEWRIKSFLSLNLGIRWETSIAPRFPSTASPLAGASTQLRNQYADLAPRVGISYDLFGKGRTVFRAGLGLYFDQSNRTMSDSFANSFPFVMGKFAADASFDGSQLTPFGQWRLFADDLKTPRTLQAYAEIVQELPGKVIVTGAYQGAFGRELLRTRPVVDANESPFIARVIDNSGWSDQHAAHLTVQRRFSSGFSLLGRYTFAKSTDNVAADPYRGIYLVSDIANSDHGLSDFDVRHDLSFNADYVLPTKFATGWKRALTRDWTVSAFYNARSGFPINVSFVRANAFWDEIVRPNLIGGVPLYLDINGRRSINPAAFQIPAGGTQGSLGRNALRGLGMSQLDLSLSRRIRFAGDSNLELKLNFGNVLNTVNLADMESTLGTEHAGNAFVPNFYFGQSISMLGGKGFMPFYLYGGPRNIQLSAKFSF